MPADHVLDDVDHAVNTLIGVLLGPRELVHPLRKACDLLVSEPLCIGDLNNASRQCFDHGNHAIHNRGNVLMRDVLIRLVRDQTIQRPLDTIESGSIRLWISRHDSSLLYGWRWTLPADHVLDYIDHAVNTLIGVLLRAREFVHPLRQTGNLFFGKPLCIGDLANIFRQCFHQPNHAVHEVRTGFLRFR